MMIMITHMLQVTLILLTRATGTDMIIDVIAIPDYDVCYSTTLQLQYRQCVLTDKSSHVIVNQILIDVTTYCISCS